MPARGRPSKYKPEFVEQARKYCELGATYEELAKYFSVDVAQIKRWSHVHDDFRAALKVGKDAADERVERSLYQRALGGDTTACIFWLKNRRSDLWRDKTEKDVNITRRVEPHEMTEDQIAGELARLEAQLAGAKAGVSAGNGADTSGPQSPDTVH